MKYDVECLTVLDFQRYVIIHVVYCQTHIWLTVGLVVSANDPDAGILGLLLYG